MRRFILILSGFFLYITLSAQYYVRGEHNGWGFSNPLNQRLTLNSGSTYATVFSANVNQDFKIANSNYSEQWSRGYYINEYNKRWTIPYQGNNAKWTGSPLAYIAVITENPYNYIGYSNPPTNDVPKQLPTAIMTLSAPPIGIISTSQIGTDQGGGNYQTYSTANQTINITLSAAKCAEENIYLRYTTNNWASSNWVLASGSGTNYTASIPGQSNGTLVSYYILTTTLSHPAWDLDNYPDLMTLNYDTNSGYNYSYTVNIALAVKYLSFEAIEKGLNDARIVWTTTKVDDNSRFELEYSLGKDFKSLAKNPDFIKSDENTYTYTHLNVPKGTIYYRLKEVSPDGRVNYSIIITLLRESQYVNIFPNPGYGQIQFSGLPEGKTTIEIMYPSGKILIKELIDKSKNEIDLREIKTGNYIILLTNNLYQKSFPYIKL
jgi:hypothetical protein